MLIKSIKHRIIRVLRNHPFLRNVFTLVSGSAIAQMIPLAVYPLVTRLYTPAELGLFATFMTYAGAVAVIATLRYDQALLLPEKSADAKYLLGISIGITAVVSFLSLIFVASGRDWFAGLTGLERIAYAFWLLPAAVFFTGVFNSFMMWGNRMKNYPAIARSTVLQSSASSGVKLLGGINGNPVALILSYIIGHAASAVYLLRIVPGSLRGLSGAFSYTNMRKWMRHYRYFPIYDMPQVLIYTISGNLPVIVFTRFFTESKAGFYALAFTVIFRPVNLLAQSIQKVLAQKIIQQYNEGQSIYAELKKLAVRMLYLSIPVAIATGWVAPPLFTWIFGKPWMLVGTYVQILLPMLVFLLLETVFDFIPNMFYRQQTVFWISILYFVLRIVSLGIGVWMEDIIFALILFSASGMLVKAGSFVWYLHLAKTHDPHDGTKPAYQ